MTISLFPARLVGLHPPVSQKMGTVNANHIRFLHLPFSHQITINSRQTRPVSTLLNSVSGMDQREKPLRITSIFNASSTKMSLRVVSISIPSPDGKVDGLTSLTVCRPKELFKAEFSLSNHVSFFLSWTKLSMPTA